MDGERQSQPTARPQHAPNLAQAGQRVRPHLHGIDGECLVAALIGQWQALHRSLPQIDNTLPHRRGIAPPGLSQQLRRWIDAGDGPRCACEHLDRHPGPEADFENPVLALNVEQPDRPGGTVACVP
jgi:hypothetical protein